VGVVSASHPVLGQRYLEPHFRRGELLPSPSSTSPAAIRATSTAPARLCLICGSRYSCRPQCWLKHQRDPLLTPKYNARGNYSAEQRQIHTTMPPAVQWVSGVIGRGSRGGKGWMAADEHVASCFGTECKNEFVRLRRKARLPV
jgi:hypothetical protein